MKILPSIILLFSLSTVGKCQENDYLKFKINERIILVKDQEKNLNLSGTLSNSTTNNLILYAFRKTMILDSSADSIFFNDVIKNGGAGSVLVLLDKDGNKTKIHREVCFDCVDNITEDSHNSNYLAIAAHKAKNIYEETAEIINRGKSKSVSLTASFSNIDLQKGEYKMYMIYYCGAEIHDIINIETTRRDEVRFNAELFRGWIKSDTVRLIVE